jgi:hypothetical protein
MKSCLRSVLFAAVASILMTGCITLGLYETARTAAPGEFQFGGWVSPAHVVVAEGEGGALFFPFPGLYAKLGVAPGFDLGATWAMGPGLGLNGKLQFARGPVDAALHLGGGFYGFFGFGSGGLGFYSLSPRLVISSEEQGRFPIAVNGGVNYLGVTEGGDGYSYGSGAMMLAGGLGFPLRLGKDRSLRVMPQLDVNVPVYGTADYGEGYETYDMFNGALVSFGISAAYVGKDRTD